MDKLREKIGRSEKLDQYEKGLLLQAEAIRNNGGKWVAFHEKFIGVVESLRLKGLVSVDLKNDCFCIESLTDLEASNGL